MELTPAVLVVLVVVAHEGRYLIVQERDGSFYLPAGKVDAGEDLLAAAARETLEEAGVEIELRGLLGFDHAWSEAAQRTRLRFVFVGAPRPDAAPPKMHSDVHSRGAAWLTKLELRAKRLRHPEALTWIERFEAASGLLPCSAYEAYGTRPAGSIRRTPCARARRALKVLPDFGRTFTPCREATGKKPRREEACRRIPASF